MKIYQAITYAEYKFPDMNEVEQLQIAMAYMDGYIEAVKDMTGTVKEMNQKETIPDYMNAAIAEQYENERQAKKEKDK